MQNLKSLVDKETKEHYRSKIEALKEDIIKRFNDDYSTGKIINSKWLKSVISEFYNRPTGEDDYRIFLVPFIDNFINESEHRINPKTGKKISFRTIQKYKTTLGQIKDFEELEKSKFKIADVNLSFHKKFTTYLKLDRNYSNTMIEKIISQLKAFVKEAKEKGYDYSLEVESSKFTFRRDETIETYLNEDEINKVFELDLSANERLNNTKDLFIIGLRTGLRISDLKRIHQFLFTDDVIIISATEKTGATVQIPLHPQVKEVLKKRGGKLPKVISEQKFNNYIKEICKEAGFTEKIIGNKRNPKTNRKEKGYYPKYQLVSSHICRRSFATNLYGKIDDRTIMQVTTHKSVKQFHKYIRTSQTEYVERLATFWEQQDELINSKPQLKVSR
ncbi:transposase [Neptunitalea chrysea]|uniref:Transposase n=2 Tax=Neptunitalea chrysea TaxID=1647581 RepID=A0A9W6B8F7_9FLAO|nr:transposase [Neptunitalea chrysea]